MARAFVTGEPPVSATICRGGVGTDYVSVAAATLFHPIHQKARLLFYATGSVRGSAKTGVLLLRRIALAGAAFCAAFFAGLSGYSSNPALLNTFARRFASFAGGKFQRINTWHAVAARHQAQRQMRRGNAHNITRSRGGIAGL